MLAKLHFIKPEDVEIEEVAEFIRDAVTSWGGGLHRDDPLHRSLSLLRLIVDGREFKITKGSDKE